MKKIQDKILYVILAVTTLLCGCGEDRSSEFHELTKENRWLYDVMKENYLWRDSITEPNSNVFFATNSKFFSQMLNKNDKASSFVDTTTVSSYGITFSLMRDPLEIAPARVYALVENVEPKSVAGTAGIERGMYIATINGKNLNMGIGPSLTDGDAQELGTCKIILDNETGNYVWSEESTIAVAASTKVEPSPIPITTIIESTSGKIGYIQCDNFDAEKTIADIQNTLSLFISEGAENIVLDLRYNESHSLVNAAEIAAMFLSPDKQGLPFCTLYKNFALTEKEEIVIPETNINLAERTLFIVTSNRTKEASTALVRALYNIRESSRTILVGKNATGNNIFTERIDSPYLFAINLATAIIYDAKGELLQPLTPNYEIDEFSDNKNIYPMGDKRELILYNISYIIDNGVMP